MAKKEKKKLKIKLNINLIALFNIFCIDIGFSESIF